MPELRHGAKFNIGTEPVRLVPEVDLKLGRVIIFAHSANTATIYLGIEGVDAGVTEEHSGFPISPGAAITLSDVNLKEIWVVSTAAGQKIFWIGT